MKLFGSSGIRKVVDKAFLQLAFEIALAVGNSYSSMVIGCDTRTSGEAMKDAFLSGLLASGAEAFYAGTVATPTLAFAARYFKAGAMITASHNPPEYNGIKLFNPDGSSFDAAQREQIEEAVSAGSARVTGWQQLQHCTEYPGAIEEHVNRILVDFPDRLDTKVVIDCVCGAASMTTPYLLAQLGCEVLTLNCQPSGYFPRKIEPTPENLTDLMNIVKAEHADLGIAHDADGDRIAVIDENGRFVPADKLMSLFTRHLKARKLVTTVDASMIIDEIGVDVVRTRVGDAFVSDELRICDKLDSREKFGGESSGCFIFPAVSLCPDGIYSAALIAQLASEHKISDLIDQIPSYPVLRGSIPADPAIMKEVENELTELVKYKGKLERVDGIRVAFDDGWLLIRPSGTEPKIRITAEARNTQRAEALYGIGVNTIKKCLTDQGNK